MSDLPAWASQEAAPDATPAWAKQPAQPAPHSMSLWDATKTVVGQQIKSLVDMFKLPGDVYAGRKDLNDPQTLQAGIGLGVNAALGHGAMKVPEAAAIKPLEAAPALKPAETPSEAPAPQSEGTASPSSALETPPKLPAWVAKEPAPEQASKLPEYLYNGPTGIKTSPVAGKSLWHETSPENAADLVKEDMTNDAAGIKGSNLYVADNPDIAIGHGGKGVRIEYNGDLVSAVEHKKPGTGAMAGREYRTNATGNNSIRSIVVAPGAKFSMPDSWGPRFAHDFEAKTLADGSTQYTRRSVVPASTSATPQPAGAAAASTADILRGNINDQAKAAAATDPGFISGMKETAAKLKASLGLDADAETAKGLIQKQRGREGRVQQQASARFTDALRRSINSAPLEDRLDIIDYIQHRSDKAAAGFVPDESIRPVIDAVRDIGETYRKKLESRPQTEQLQFKEDYLRQAWQDPEKARQFFGSGKEGSTSFKKKSVYADYAEGIRAGLIPKSTDPIEITMHYVQAVGDHIAAQDAFRDAEDMGKVVWRARGEQPEGWVELQGQTARSRPGQVAYAPEGFAVVWNNFVSREAQGIGGDLLRGARSVFNSITAMKMAISGYHAVNMAGEATVAGVADAIDKTMGGDLLGAVKAAAKAPAKFVTSALRGRQVVKAYLTDYGSPELRHIVDLMTDANFRVKGKGRVTDEYRVGGAVNLWKAIRRGSLKAEAAASLKDVHGHPIAGTFRTVAKTLGSVFESINAPLFDTYIPLIKNGAMYDMLDTWLRAHPDATIEEQVAAARKAGQEVDNRFGEMNQDNIFWNKTAKLAAQAAVFSYSYELGSARLLGGAARDFAAAIPKLARGTGRDAWTRNMSYAVALPFTMGTLGAIYMYLKTGKTPQTANDLFNPLTGGTSPGGTGKVPERAVIPSYLPQVFNLADNPWREIGNKVNAGAGLAMQLAKGQDWREDPIAPSDASKLETVKKYFTFIGKELLPIPFEQTVLPGSHIQRGERMMGVRPAGMRANDPKDYKEMKQYLALRADAEKAYHDAITAAEKKTGSRPRIFKRAFVKRYIREHQQTYKGAQ